MLTVLKSSEFIHSASVPVIKLKVDLMKVQQLMKEKFVQKLSYDMRILNVDVTFDTSVEQLSGTSMSLAIQSVQKIKEL